MVGFLNTIEQFFSARFVVEATDIVVLDGTSDDVCAAQLEIIKPINALHVSECVSAPVCDHVETVVAVTTTNLEVIAGTESRERILSAKIDASVFETFAIESDNVVLRTAPDGVDNWRGERAANAAVLEINTWSVPASKVASIDGLEHWVVHDRRGQCIDARSLPFERLLKLLVDMVVDSGGDLIDVV